MVEKGNREAVAEESFLVSPVLILKANHQLPCLPIISFNTGQPAQIERSQIDFLSLPSFSHFCDTLGAGWRGGVRCRGSQHCLS